MFLKVTETNDCLVRFYTTIACCFDPIRTAVMRDTFLTDFCKNHPNEICSRLSEKRRQGFLSPRSSKITVMKEKERRKRKSEEKRKKQWLRF